MEDYIIKEIEKIGMMLRAILSKAGMLRDSSARQEQVASAIKTSLVGQLDIDIDTLLSDNSFPRVLIDRYGFSGSDLALFAEVLYDFFCSAGNMRDKATTARAILSVYSLLTELAEPYPFNAWDIISDVKSYLHEYFKE